MTLTGLLSQLLNGWSEASSLFLVAAGLSLIFGVTRIANFAHGSFYMLGLYAAVSLADRFGATPWGFWASVLAASLAVGVAGALVEIVLLRRLYRAPELFQLLATFALALVINDATLWLWGPEDMLGRRAPGLSGSVQLFDRPYPTYSLVLIAIGPVVLGALWWLLTRTRWGLLVRAARQDRGMLAALGVNQAWLFTSVFALGAALAGLGGAVQLPREPASLGLDLRVIGDAFVVVVMGGLGSLPGAYVAALAISLIKAVMIGAGEITVMGSVIALPHLTLVAEFVVMALVLIARPWGLFGRPDNTARAHDEPDAPPARATRRVQLAYGIAFGVLLLLPSAHQWWPYAPVLAADMLIAILFAASLHFIMGPGGMASFGHAAYFGLAAYGAGVLVRVLGWPMWGAFAVGPWLAAGAALVFGWLCVRLSGVYLAMLTLAIAQIVWALVFQWDGFTGGSNGLTGLWPSEALAGDRYYFLTLGLVGLGVYGLRRVLASPFGHAMRAARDAPLRAEALGIDTHRVQWTAFVIAAWFAGVAGVLYAFGKGSISPDIMAVGKSVDGLVMVLLGGVQQLAGPVLGAALFTWLQDTLIRSTEYWRAVLGALILLLVLAAPGGVAGLATGWSRLAGALARRRGAREAAP